MQNFFENLVRLRRAKYPSAKKFAKELGLPYNTYIAYENAQKPAEPRYDTLIKIALLLGVSTDELLGYECTEKVHFSRNYEELQEINAEFIKLLGEQEKRIVRILNRLEELEAGQK